MSAEDFRDPIEGQIPIGRMLQPEEVANISIYLASDESNGMTGQTITLSGGMRMG
jgi:NAD(P)-dependent dehydrogenase (short-subunit alcohol dehydrogenase family)